MTYKKLGIIYIILLFLTVTVYAQESVLKLDPFQDVTDQLKADTAANHGIPANRVYELTRDEFYLQDEIFNVPAGKTLRIRAEAGTGKIPVIYLAEVAGTGRPPGNWVVLNGGNLELKDMCVVGYYEDFWDQGLAGIQGGLIQTGAAGSSIILDNVIMSNINGQHIRTNAATSKIKVTNSIFANMGALSRSNLGAGKGLDLRDVAHDSVIIVNTTFVNYQDRVIRHLDLSTGGTNTGAIKYLLFDHNTLVNGMGYHGTLSLGNVGDQIIITNNLFYDAFALGEDSTDNVRAAEWLRTGEIYANGNSRMTWILSVPNEQTQWTVKGNYYVVSPEGLEWLLSYHFGAGAFGIGSPLSYHVIGKLGANADKAFIKEDNLTLVNKPRLMTNMMTWYEDPAGGNRSKNTPTPAFVVPRDDYDRRKVEYFRDTLDLSYPTSAAAYSGAEGYPAGDLHWFPQKFEQWKSGISGLPAISLSANSISFGSVKINSAKTDSVQISNTGGSTLSISQISSSNAAFTFSPAALDIPAFGSAYLHVTFTPADTNSQNGSISLTDNSAGSPHSISVSGKGEAVVGVNSDLTNTPKSFALNQNYPNPFNPTTNISYAVPKQSMVTLTVYNVLGQEVIQLVNQEQRAGYYTVTWNGKNASGTDMSTGIYFYQIRSNDFVNTKKMQLLK